MPATRRSSSCRTRHPLPGTGQNPGYPAPRPTSQPATKKPPSRFPFSPRPSNKRRHRKTDRAYNTHRTHNRRNPMRPTIVCHMMSSIDGRLNGDRWSEPFDGKNRDILFAPYYTISERLSPEAHMLGRNTVQIPLLPQNLRPHRPAPGRPPRTLSGALPRPAQTRHPRPARQNLLRHEHHHGFRHHRRTG